MKKILITGGNGQVAYELVRLLQGSAISFSAPSKKDFDITCCSSIDRVLTDVKPDAVINTAAYTYVDLAEKNPELADAVNHEGAKNLAKMCKKNKSILLHISTDYIFDGNQTTPYVETSEAAPINVYGATKRLGELGVQEQDDQAMILRVSGVFGNHGNNFVKTILRLAKEREVLRVVTDQTICPTPAKAIAETILQMLLNPHPGIYHYCGAEVTNWHAFAECIVDIARSLQYPVITQTIEKITTADYVTPAKRPLYSVLNCDHIHRVFGITQPDWKKGLTNVITELSAS
jgi:dTDP-4-dehydrorhamnose reductase